jgi:inhibitor of cysteine peptidase
MCAAPAQQHASPLPQGQRDVRQLTEKAHDTEITLAVGDTMAVRLEALPSAGYAWQIGSCDETVLQPVGKPTYELPTQPKSGAPETAVLRFRAVAAGKVRLELRYLRPWETSVPPAKVFRIAVDVR